MINLTVRTLDCGNYYFTLEDQSTVLALKHKIRDSLHVELHTQRLIYSGRILSDDINLTALDVDGKVIHMVQKEPPKSTMRSRCGGPYRAGPSGAGPSRAGTSGAGPSGAGPSGAGTSGAGASGYQVPNEQIRPETFNIPYMMNDTDRRLVSINELILDINESLHDLEQLQQPQNDTDWGNGFVRPRQREITRAQTPRDFMETRVALETTQAQVEHFRRRYTQLIRNMLSNGHNSDHELSSFRSWSEKIQAIEHSLAHTFHALSEFSIEVDNFNNIRLVSEPGPNPARPPLPVETIRRRRSGNIRAQPFNLGMENATSNANQGMNINLERCTTFILSSQTPMGDRNDLVNPPPQTTEQIVLGPLDLDSILRSNPNPGAEDISYSPDSDSPGDNDVMFITSDAQGFLQNITPFFRQEEPFPGTSQFSDQSEDRFRMPSVFQDLPNQIYDRFLFCDSRHAHAALQQRRYHLTYQLEEERRETLRNIENSLRVMINYVPGLTEDYIISMAHLLCLSSFRETYMNAALTLLVRQICVHNAFILQGNELPRVDEFPKLRDHHHSFAVNVLMRSNNDPVDYVMQNLGRFLNSLPNITPLKPNLNLEDSLRAYFNAYLPNRLVGLMGEVKEGIEFIKQYFSDHQIFFNDVCDIVKFHCQNGTDGFKLAFNHFMDLLIEPMAERLKPLFNLLYGVLRNRVATRQENLPRIQPFIKKRAPCENSLPTENRNRIFEDDCISVSSTDSVNNAQESTPVIDVADVPVPTLDMIVHVISDDEDSMISANGMEWTSATRPMSSTTAERQSAITLSDDESDCDCVCEESISLSPSNEAPSGSSRVSENSDAKAVAAGDSNSGDAPEQNWERIYVPIFNSDEVAQRAGGSNEPLSDAYLAGMSASKRRCVRRQRPPCNLEDFLTGCIDAAGDSSNMTDNDLHLTLSVHMCNLGSTRFTSNEEVNEEANSRRFMYVRRYFNSDRSASRRDGPNTSSSKNASSGV